MQEVFTVSREGDHLRFRDPVTNEVLGTLLFSEGEYLIMEHTELGTFKSLFEAGRAIVAFRAITNSRRPSGTWDA